MTLTLTDTEVVVYMTMKQTIEDLQSALKSANEYIALLEDKNIPDEHEWKEPTPPINPDDLVRENPPLDEPVEFADAHTAWTEEEKLTLKYRIFKTGTYSGDARTFHTIRALFPNRTEDGVKAMIYSLGGTCKKGMVQPKLKGVK